MRIEDRIQQISVQSHITAIPTEILLNLNLYKKNDISNREIVRMLKMTNNFCMTFRCAQIKEFNKDECNPNLYIGFIKIFPTPSDFNEFEKTIVTLEDVSLKMKKKQQIKNSKLDFLQDTLMDFTNRAIMRFNQVDDSTYGLI